MNRRTNLAEQLVELQDVDVADVMAAAVEKADAIEAAAAPVMDLPAGIAGTRVPTVAKATTYTCSTTYNGRDHNAVAFSYLLTAQDRHGGKLTPQQALDALREAVTKGGAGINPQRWLGWAITYPGKRGPILRPSK